MNEDYKKETIILSNDDEKNPDIIQDNGKPRPDPPKTNSQEKSEGENDVK